MLVTTKHPEDIKYAYRAGLIRKGHIYREDAPELLLQQFNSTTYDGMYTEFCLQMSPASRLQGPNARASSLSLPQHQPLPPTPTPQHRPTSPDTPPPSHQTLIVPSVSLVDADSGHSCSTSQSTLHPASGHHQQRRSSDIPPIIITNPNDLSNSDLVEILTTTIKEEYDENEEIASRSSLDLSKRKAKQSANQGEEAEMSQGLGVLGPSAVIDNNNKQLPMAEWPICERRRTAYISQFIHLDPHRLSALICKNFQVMRGNLWPLFIFYFLFPALQALLVCFVFSRPVHDLPLAIPVDLVNENGNPFIHEYVEKFVDRNVFKINFVPTTNDSIAQIRQGRAWATLTPPTSFMDIGRTSWLAKNLAQKFHMVYHNRNITPNAFASSQSQSSFLSASMDGGGSMVSHYPNSSLCSYFANQQFNPNSRSARHNQNATFGIGIQMDNSNYVITQQIFHSFIRSMSAYMASPQLEHHFKPCPHLAPAVQNQVLIKLNEVVYGSTDFQFLQFLLPGYLVAIFFTYALVLTAYSFVREDVRGLRERTLSTGTSGFEILVAHFVSQSKLFLAQEIMVLFIVFNIFGLPFRGHLMALWMLILLQGLVGICFGLFAAVIAPNPRGAALFTSGRSSFWFGH